MAPLANLYNQSQPSPLQQLSAMPIGMQAAWNVPMAFRQAEEDKLANLYNQQVLEQYNPTQIQKEQLANKQQQYMMPTYEAQGMEAQAKMATPNYYTSKAGSELSGYNAKQAEDENKLAAERGKAPYTEDISRYAAIRQERLGKLEALIHDVEMYPATDPEGAIEALKKIDPANAPWVEKAINMQGFEPARKLYLDMLQDSSKRLAETDPEQMKKIHLENIKGEWNIKNIQEQGKTQLAIAQQKSSSEKEYDAYIAAYLKANPGASKLEAHEAWIRTRYQPDKTIIGPDGKPLFTETKGQGGATTSSAPSSTSNPQYVTIEGKRYILLGKGTDGTLKIADPATGKTGTYSP